VTINVGQRDKYLLHPEKNKTKVRDGYFSGCIRLKTNIDCNSALHRARTGLGTLA
jgi:hypothetical protein